MIKVFEFLGILLASEKLLVGKTHKNIAYL